MNGALKVVETVLILLHGPEGHTVHLNPMEVVTIREPTGVPEGHIAKNIRCIITTVDGKLANVREDCAYVEREMRAAGR
jgi:hypothetical protein